VNIPATDCFAKCARCILALPLALPLALAAQTYIASEDEAYYQIYADGWATGDNGGRGFGPWRLFAPLDGFEEADQYAGFFIADASMEADLAGSAREGRAFGIFANGTGFEETVAFRPFDRPLDPGDVFSMRFEFDGFAKKFERDATSGSSTVGVALRTSTDAADLEALSKDRAVVFAVIDGLSTYQILDAEGRLNTRVFIDPQGVELGFTLREDQRYDLQITTLSDQVAHHFEGRPLLAENASESPEATDPTDAIRLRAFALFNLNGGRNNAYSGAFQISRQEANLP
jgi:hypothetical protein